VVAEVVVTVVKMEDLVDLAVVLLVKTNRTILVLDNNQVLHLVDLEILADNGDLVMIILVEAAEVLVHLAAMLVAEQMKVEMVE
jgi:hypothetical protein